MTISQGTGGARNRPHQGAFARAAFRASARLAAALILSTAVSAMAAPGTVSAADGKCLTCHSMSGLAKTLGDGEKLSLHVDQAKFSDSAHSIVGCRGCHREVDLEQHPVMDSIASAREFTLDTAQVCRNCHAGKFEQYEGSIHANLVAAGNPDAPVCSSCHDPHSTRSIATAETISGQPCKTCHEDIFDAYAGSVHGKARVGEGHMEAPICADCHQAHGITAVAAGESLKQACLSCHEGALLAHDQWLPNSTRHLESVACPACHSPMAERAVDLRLYDKEAGELVVGNPLFEERVRAADAGGDGLDPLELWSLVRDTNRDEADADVTLRGRLEVRNGAQAHQLAFKQEAVRNCDTCHQHGAEVFENVTVSVSGADGRRIRYEAEEDTLTSAVSVDSVGGFYTAGGTRIRILDILLVLGVLAGIGIPAAHWTMRKFLRNKG